MWWIVPSRADDDNWVLMVVPGNSEGSFGRRKWVGTRSWGLTGMPTFGEIKKIQDEWWFVRKFPIHISFDEVQTFAFDVSHFAIPRWNEVYTVKAMPRLQILWDICNILHMFIFLLIIFIYFFKRAVILTWSC